MTYIPEMDEQTLNDLEKLFELAERGTNTKSDENAGDTDIIDHNEQYPCIAVNPTKADLWLTQEAKELIKKQNKTPCKNKTRSNIKNKFQESIGYKIAINNTKDDILNNCKQGEIIFPWNKEKKND